MAFLKRLAFCAGLVLGLATVAAAGAVSLTYLFTGKLPAVEMGKSGANLVLMTPDEVTALVREQMGRTGNAAPPIQLA